MTNDTKETNNSGSTRRKILGMAGGAGLTAIASSANSAATSYDDAINELTFVELGLKFKPRKNIKKSDHYDPLPYYGIENDELHFSVIPESKLELLKKSDGVVRYNDLHALPTRITRRQHRSINLGLNKRLNPTEGTALSHQISTPAIRIEKDQNIVNVSVKGKETQVSPNSTQEISLGPSSAKPRGQKAIEVESTVHIKNYGRISAFIDNIVEGK